MSLGGVLDKSMPVFKVIATILAVTTIFFLFGTISFLMNAGFTATYRDDISQDTTCQEKEGDAWIRVLDKNDQI